MAIKTAIVTIEAEGRDKGKVFILTEAPIFTQEDFAARAFMAALNSGAEIPDNVAEMGIPGLLLMGAKGISMIPYEKLKPLMDEMLQCIEYQPDPNKASYKRKLQFEGDIEEVGTLIKLRKEIIDLHTGFFTAASRLTSDIPPQPGTVATS